MFSPFFLISHPYFFSLDISTASSSLLLPSGCSLSFLYMNTFFPNIPLPSYVFPSSSHSLFLNHNLTELRKKTVVY